MISDASAARDPQSHHDLVAWQRAVALVKGIYEATASLPDVEKYGLSSQMRRAAVSIPSNIAEGAARRSRKEFLHSLYVARGSLAEIETQLVLCRELGYITEQDALNQSVSDLFGILGGLIRSLRSAEE